ncbi:MAG: flavin reductase family protein [Myxococcales bacterium]|nr:flavin reductase family protein [Myxococcales bacterium]
MSIGADDFKAGMSRRAGAVAIVTARSGETRHGMTVTDWTGVSLSPPLVLVCADKASNTLGVVREGGCFALNVLASDQADLSNRFASKKLEWQRFDGIDCETAVTGAPLLAGCVATFDCALAAEHDAGDHVLLVGRVEALSISERAPLVYLGGRYCGATPLDGGA